MRINNKSIIIYSEVFLPHEFNLHLSELLSNGCSAGVIVVVHIFDVDYYEFRESISGKNSLELVLPIGGFVNFLSHHGFDIHNVNAVTDFVH